MGSLHLHTGPQGSYYYFKDDILDLLSSDQKESFIAILPVNRAVRYLKKDLVSALRTRAFFDPPIYTFSSFAQKLYQSFPQRKKIISQPMRLLLVNNILQSGQTGLNYFQSQWTLGNGLIQKAERMVEEFCQFGFRPNDFNEPPPNAEIKYNDFGYLVSQLFEIYSDHLIDESSLLSEIVNILNFDFLKKFSPELNKIFISGFGIYSPPMLKYLSIVKDYCDVEIKLEHASKNSNLFKHTSNAYDALSKIATKISDHAESKDDLSKFMFSPSTEDFQKKKLTHNLEIHGNYNRIQEIRFIASKIKEMHHENGNQLSRIGVTFPNIEKYIPLIRKVFKEFELPYNLSTGFSMSESPLIQSLVQVLRVAATGFKSEEVYKLALSPFLKNDMSVEAEFIRQCSKKFRLNYISDQWVSSIQNYVDRFQGKSSDLNVLKELSAEEISSLLERIRSFVSIIKPLSGKISAEKFQSDYIQVLKELGLISWYDRDDGFMEIFEKEKEFRAFNRFIKLLDQMVWILNYSHKSTEIPIKNFYDSLSLIFESATYNLREWADYGVQIMPRLEILSLQMDTLFIGGLVEGEFPRHFTRDIFFNDEERATMGLNASEDLLSQDRFVFYQLLTSGATHIVLSYPEYDGDAKILPSTFLTNLKEIISNITINTQKLKHPYLSKDDILESLGASLKFGLTDNDMENYHYWLANDKKQIAGFWQNGIQTWYDKKNQQGITVFEGNLTDSNKVKKVIAENTPHRPFSITALETYAFCPMQYFMHRILNLKTDEEPEATISSLERGNAVHKILYLFYSRLTDDQKNTPWNYQELLEQTAAEVFASLPYDDILWTIEKEKYFGNKEQPGLWHRFLEVEKENIEASGFVPAMFETSFGYSSSDSAQPGNPPLIVKFKDQSLKIYGKIDRIDINSEGKFSVLDYKTGAAALGINLAQIINGESLQLPIYAAATEQILSKKDKEYRAVVGTYYQVQDGLNCRQKPVFVDQSASHQIRSTKDSVLPNSKFTKDGEDLLLSDVIKISLDHVADYVQEIINGNFRHTFNPKDEKCVTYCAFRKICRKDVSKLQALGEQH